MTRYLSSIPIGIAATLALLYAMQALIASGEQVLTTPTRLGGLDFIHIKRDEQIQTRDEVIERIAPPVELPKTPHFEPKGNEGEVGVVVDRAPPPPGPTTGVNFGMHSDGPLVSIVRVAPTYPGHLLGIEGFVVVRFDVTAEGFVTNVRVVDSSHRGFEKNAVRAAEKFRYKPRVVDGVAVATTNVGYRFRFELEK